MAQVIAERPSPKYRPEPNGGKYTTLEHVIGEHGLPETGHLLVALFPSGEGEGEGTRPFVAAVVRKIEPGQHGQPDAFEVQPRVPYVPGIGDKRPLGNESGTVGRISPRNIKNQRWDADYRLERVDSLVVSGRTTTLAKPISPGCIGGAKR